MGLLSQVSPVGLTNQDHNFDWNIFIRIGSRVRSSIGIEIWQIKSWIHKFMNSFIEFRIEGATRH